ncbi:MULTISPECIES: TetR/AcrR family transcriptional regulator [Dermacoccus]|uniref:TetR/AcrR family transcriptional regulator n=3 Tax=Dermacoccus TaxID=57495 RepID=A0A417ZBC1_9MICO|nr:MULTISPECIES: TetR/AcrR family transcriptional regulator [Dermacoccus]QNK52611.1 TetR/AcrR family transcriptional regulator [Dermacoccus sp. PAMC28757]RHW47954.1 TetR/AcrR family transcriptional regulator [Dermacoccus abyssi]
MTGTDDPTKRGRLPRSARRAQLMEAAQSVFVESGFHSAAMDEIAERAHVSKPVLYQHFPGKLDLYLALLDQHTREFPELVRKAVESTTDNNERVAAAVGAFFEFVEREDAGFRLVFESDLTNEPAVAERVERSLADTADIVAQVVREDTGLPEAEATLVAVALVGMSQVVARYWIAQHEPIPREEAARIVGILGWRGLTGFPKTAGDEITR